MSAHPAPWRVFRDTAPRSVYDADGFVVLTLADWDADATGAPELLARIVAAVNAADADRIAANEAIVGEGIARAALSEARRIIDKMLKGESGAADMALRFLGETDAIQ
jgi:hypothetical protein